MLKLRYLLIVMILMMISIGVCFIKYYVKELERETQELNQHIISEKETISTLKAEWAYLNKPERLRHLVDKYLDLQSLELHQIHDLEIVKNNVNTTQQKPVFVGNRTQLSNSLLTKVGYENNHKIEKIKWDSKRNKFVKVKIKNE